MSTKLTRPFELDPGWYEERARGLLGVRGSGPRQALEQIREWHPRFTRASDAEIREAEFTIEDARLVYARQHGFASWDAFMDHVGRVASGLVVEPFQKAFEALKTADADALSDLLRSSPELAVLRGTNGNTLLNLACSLVCSAPGRAALRSGLAERIFAMLLAAGTDVNQSNERGWTPLHQAAYGNQPEVTRLLLSAGARTDAEAHGSGGTPLAVALFWGHREVADVLAAREVVPRNLRIAAALGRRDLVEACFLPDGTLTHEAAWNRGFYRPHSGFAEWRPSEARQEILDEALVWAAKNDRSEVLPLLVERGAHVDGNPYQGTALCWAAFAGALASAAQLLALGADVDRRATFGGADGRGLTALHCAAQNDRRAMVQLLIERGADPTIEDEVYHATPLGWADHFGAAGTAEYLRGLSA